METNYGVLLLALNHPYYGNMAHNLCLMLKARYPNMPVALAYNARGTSQLRNYYWNDFDHLVEVPDEMQRKGGKLRPFRVKCQLGALAPWQYTLYLDADVALWAPKAGLPTPNLEEWIQRQIAKPGFECIAHCYGQPSAKEAPQVDHWGVNSEQMVELYGVDEEAAIPEVNTSFVLFAQSPTMQAVWQTALEVYDSPPASTEVFAGDVPDEMPIRVGLAKQGVKLMLDRVPFLPLAEPGAFDNGFDLKSLYASYFGLSMQGHQASPTRIEQYNSAVIYAHHRFRAQQPGTRPQDYNYPWKWQNKRDWSESRTHK